MRPKILLLTLVLALPLSALAQNKLKLTFSKDSPRVIFTSKGRPTGLPKASEVKNDVTVETTPASGDDTVVVWDRDSNNAAIRPLGEIKGGTWAVVPQDFRDLGIVTVSVQHDGKPVAAAQVSLSSGKQSYKQLLDPSSSGQLKFFGVTPGNLNLAVDYKTNGNTQTASQSQSVPLDRPRSDPLLTIVIPDPVETVGAAPATGVPGKDATIPAVAGKGADADKDGGDGRKSGAATALTLLFGLAIAIGGGYFLLKYIQKNPEQLKQLGVQIPEAPVPDGAQPGAVPAPIPTPQPVQQILLGDAPPTPLGIPMAAVAAPTAATSGGQPRLAGDAGLVVDLNQGETLVGRDPGLPLSLAGESTVSKRHASIQFDGKTVILTDLGSTNGTFVNGVRLQSATTLSVGDVVQFGEKRFRYEA